MHLPETLSSATCAKPCPAPGQLCLLICQAEVPPHSSWPQPSLQMPFSWNCCSQAANLIPLAQASTHPSALAKEVQPADQAKGLGDPNMQHTREGRLAARLQWCIWNLLIYSVNELQLAVMPPRTRDHRVMEQFATVFFPWRTVLKKSGAQPNSYMDPAPCGF